MMTFGENLKNLRGERGYSQGELATLLNMHATHISRYERNLASPTVEVVKRMCEALDVSADLLIYGDQKRMAKQRIEDDELIRLFAKVQNLQGKDIAVVKSLIDAYVLKAELQQKLGV